MINPDPLIADALNYLAAKMRHWPDGADFVYLGPGKIIHQVEGGDSGVVNYISREQWAAAKTIRDLYRSSTAERYPKYYRDVRHLDSIDVYRVHRLFGVIDNELHHASKKILLCGVRTGGKPARKEIEEARDTLNRWLELEAEDEHQ